MPRPLRRRRLRVDVRAQRDVRQLQPRDAGARRLRLPARAARVPQHALVPHEPLHAGADRAADGAARVRVLCAEQLQDPRGRQVLPRRADRDRLPALRQAGVRDDESEPSIFQCTGAGGRCDDAAHDVLHGAGRVLGRDRLPQPLVAGHVHDGRRARRSAEQAVLFICSSCPCYQIADLLGLLLQSASFAFPGRIVLDEIKSVSQQHKMNLSAVSSTVMELEQSHHQLWVLLICNVVSNSFQLVVDIYVTYGVVGAKTCNSMFFEDGSGALEQSVRLVVSVVSHLLPNWATIYVFYVLPRFQFSTSLDLPAMDDHEDNDEASYELLLNEQEGEKM